MNNFDEIIGSIKAEIIKHFINENTGHDISHLERVSLNAKTIQEKEGGNLYVILISAMLHDIHRIMVNKDRVFVPPADSLPLVREICEKCNVESSKIDHILNVVKQHDEKFINNNFDIETQIIQDADVLDAVGEIGLKRTLEYCKTRNIPITDISVPLDSKSFIPDLHPISTCHYIYRILIPQAKKLHTQTAKNMIENNICILESFLENNYYEKQKN